MPITFVGGIVTINASTGADVVHTLNDSLLNNDVVLILGVVRDVDDTVTITGYTQIATWDRGTTARYFLFGRRWLAGDPTIVTFDKSTATGDTYVFSIAFRGCISIGTAWEVVGTGSGTTADPSVFTGITTLTPGSMVVCTCGGEDNNNASIITTGTDPATYNEVYAESATGADGVITFSYEIRTATGATGSVSVNWNVAIPVGAGGIVIALKPEPFNESVFGTTLMDLMGVGH